MRSPKTALFLLLTIDPGTVPSSQADFSGSHTHSSLHPVSTYVDRHRLEPCESSHGNTYGNTVVEIGAAAQFGDRYTNLHIHIGDHSQSSEPEALTASTTIELIKEASEKLVHTISTIAGVPGARQHLTELQIELNSTSIVFSGLENFLRCTNSITPARAALIPVQDLVSIITQLALVCSELQVMLKQWREPQGTAEEAAVTKLQDRLQRHKLSLSLILQIIAWYEHLRLSCTKLTQLVAHNLRPNTLQLLYAVEPTGRSKKMST